MVIMHSDCLALAIPHNRPARIMPLFPFSEGMMLTAILLVTVLARAD
jgi:hypothetical protein